MRVPECKQTKQILASDGMWTTLIGLTVLDTILSVARCKNTSMWY